MQQKAPISQQQVIKESATTMVTLNDFRGSAALPEAVSIPPIKIALLFLLFIVAPGPDLSLAAYGSPSCAGDLAYKGCS